jgi:5-formyltetrahydrofolate cyclo-ligase
MKEIIRKELKEKRSKQVYKENRKKSKKIKEKLFNLPEYKSAKTVLFYVSYNTEVFTHDMINEALKEKRIIVPIINKKNCSLSLSYLESWDDLKIGAFGILEPRKKCIKKVLIEEIDLIVIPGIGFDIKGNRMGQGKGYYDRLLKKSKAIHIGLAFDFQIVEIIPLENHDIPVEIIITENRVIMC